jgi:hypothetical protein
MDGTTSSATHVAALDADDFPRPDHHVAFPAIAATIEIDGSANPVTVAEYLQRRGRLDDAGGLPYLGTLARKAPPDIGPYVRVLKDKRAARDLQAIAARLADAALGARPAAEIIESARRELDRVSTHVPHGQASTLPGLNLADVRPNVGGAQVVKGVLGLGTLVSIVGASGSGKTFALVELMLCVASGSPWRAHAVLAGLVICVELEGYIAAQNRLWAGVNHMKLRAGIPLRLTPGPLNLCAPDDVANLIAFIRAAEAEHGMKCVLIAVDTLARAMPGADENAAEGMGAAIGGLDQLRLAIGATVVVVHHFGKDESRGARGHSSLKAALDTEIEITKTGSIHVATITKQRDLPTGGRYAFALDVVEVGRDADGDPVTTCVVRPAEEPSTERKAPTGKNQAALLAALVEWQRLHDGVTLISSPDFRALAKSQGLNRQRLQEATEGLVKFGWLVHAVGGFTLTLTEAP